MKVTLPEFERAGVMVVGDVMLDRYWYGPTSRISPGPEGSGTVSPPDRRHLDPADPAPGRIWRKGRIWWTSR